MAVVVSGGKAQGLSQAEAQGGGQQEVGHLAVWSVTSAKAGNGVELLRDGSTDTFWQ
jgi:hypothetical protein